MTHDDFDASANHPTSTDSRPADSASTDSGPEASNEDDSSPANETSLSTENDAATQADTSPQPRFDADSLQANGSDSTEVYEDVGDDDLVLADEQTAEQVDKNRFQPAGSEDELRELQQPFVGRWNTLISTTNWEKGRIISQWRDALIEAGAPATEYSDEAWASRVGGVTSPHVGRLRRVHDRFGEQAITYNSLYWSHFLAALDWDDAALWLQGAVEEKWSVSKMREQRWKANGELESDRPNGSQIVEVDLDEDTPDLGTAPAQGGSNTRDYDGDTDGIAAGPAYEPPDFGDEGELAALPEGNHMNDANQSEDGGVATDPAMSPLQPFAGLPDLPDDMADVIESLKLTVLRHKSAGFVDVKADTIRRYLEAVTMLIES